MTEEGPTWLGIGAQRSGTTWLTNLLLQHPRVHLNQDRRKELHYFDRIGTKRWRPRDASRYRRLFPDNGGEFTPAYMRCPWVPELVRRTRPSTLVLVVLRDPIERYASAMRWYDQRRANAGVARSKEWIRDRGAVATWGGMYADQLALWKGFDLIVIQYELALKEPEKQVSRVWKRLGLEPVPLVDITTPSATSTSGRFEWPPGLKENLHELYLPQVKRLSGLISRDLWHSFARPQ